VSTKSILSMVAAGTVGALSIAQTAQAALTINFKFTDNTTSKTFASISSGQLITINIWAKATNNGNVAPEGLQSAIVAAVSTLNQAGITGGLTTAVRGTSWTGSGSQVGSSNNISADGLADWGSTAVTTNNIAAFPYFRARTTNAQVDADPVGNPGAADGGNAQIDFANQNDLSGTRAPTIQDGVTDQEWLIGRVVFTASAAAASGSVSYNPVVPTAGGLTSTATWWEDSTNATTAAVPVGGKTDATSGAVFSGGTGVTFSVVPEPTTLGLAGLAGLGLLRRRRA